MSFAKQESYFIVHICSRAALMLKSSLEYRAPVWISSAESHLSLLDSVVRSAEGLCEGELCFFETQKDGHCLVFAP